MTDSEIQALLKAAEFAGISTSRLTAVNPFQMQGGVAETMQAAIEATNPIQAARWRGEANPTVRLDVAAAKAGVAPMTNGAHQQLMETDADYAVSVKQAQAKREAELLAEFEQKALELRGGREFSNEPTGRWATWTKQQSALKTAMNEGAN